MKSKHFITPLVVLTFIIASCNPVETNFDQALLIGKWSRPYTDNNIPKIEYYRYDSNGSGVSWVPAEDVTEAEGQGFTWVLDKTNLTQIYIMQVSQTKITKIYTVTKLTATTLVYKDDYGTVYTFTKVI